ncbi:Gfo/Idh/MocA family protein [Maliponia aquimaris]|uniref:Glucose--fructose oxidoreductase n=1 Tax=Maliponia aquimaris TaxID=1673631 RepID=A0A238KHX5_9RHOB|nr:Gfo/Idh/MocA family oxidoreductase [Maliponia aquimaris]SMX42340.1 Glucose--fructose oxidoreductase precursor [Maliponia aquimaris]
MTADFTLSHGLRVPPLGRRLRLGFVGGGRGAIVGPWHRHGAWLSGHWDIVAGALSTNPDKARLSAADWCIAPDRAFSDYRAMAQAEAARADGIEAVAICTPNHSHHEIAAHFLNAGLDVILDKPMTTTNADAEALVALAAERGRILALTYPYAHHAMIRQAQALVAEGAIGRITQVLVEYVQDWGAEPDAPNNRSVAWRRDPSVVGRTSATGDIGTHAYHLLKTVTGLDATALRADFHRCGGAAAMEDTAFIKLRMENGAPGHVWVTQAAPGNYCGLRLRVFGDKGGLEWDQEHPEHLRLTLLNAPEQVIVRGHGSGMRPAAERLVHLPRGHGEALTDAWANLYSEIGVAVAARIAGVTLPEGLVQFPGGSEGLAGVRFMNACADSAEGDACWVSL